MNERDLNCLKDLKKKLLGSNYIDEENGSIKNILMAKEKQYYQDIKGVGISSDYCRGDRGHVENYRVVDEVFKHLTDNKPIEHTDVLHSFWHTYKTIMQLERPDLFRPLGSLKKEDEIPLEKLDKKNLPKIGKGFPPYDTDKYLVIHEKYIEYYQHYFPEYLPNEVPKKYTWIDFLLYNNDKFIEVYNKYPELLEFARLTHSVGNIIVVPKGFNRGRGANDYGDFALKSLKIFLESFNAWEGYITKFRLKPFLEKYSPISLWTGHLDGKKGSLPEENIEIEKFLKSVTSSIKKREEILLEIVRDNLLEIEE
ncbi:hypothetical protein ENLAB_32250 [Enterococcus innesii]|uniref:Uncharacterized protein n=1 Tax=Enterococcus innesii TaxID=2839759 RepID=A0ABN6NUM8_9ENTE|nr:hypothetical protein [Enterococcus innesii]BDG69661.1 hypothetical protein ENLAB_32250 [Enterococcus innesii]